MAEAMAARDFFTNILDESWSGGLHSRHDNAGSSIFARNLQKILNRCHFAAWHRIAERPLLKTGL
jgi:hypothetical protein